MTTFGTRGGSTAGKSESPMSPKSKRCARCKVVKPIECFYRLTTTTDWRDKTLTDRPGYTRKRSADGHVHRCKACW